ncbi:MAG: hypothetical protein HYR93_09390 [Chloroflexi bacterium]|nr:hypothetical protein [Chloroflexota bacterium]MBI2759109.1 hypothetical protein [Chloroflexota bacterium]
MNLIALGLVSFSGILLLAFSLIKRKSPPKFRIIPALTRLYRAIGLSVEDGTRVFIHLGPMSLLTPRGGAPLAGLGMLRHLTERTSLSDRPPIAAAGEASLALLAQDTLEAGYEAAGAGEFYQPLSGRLIGLTPFSSAAGAMSIIRDEDISASILIGHFGPEAALMAEAAERENTFLLGASDDLSSQAALYASAQEVLIGEELYAAGAYLGATASHAASITVQDILRWLIILGLLAGAALKLFGMI